MLYLLYQINPELFNLCKYITFRSFVAFVLSFLFSLVWGKVFIKKMRERKVRQIIREDGPKSHVENKQNTPTMGGVFIASSALVAFLVAGNLSAKTVWPGVVVYLSYFFLGFCDDYLKVVKKNTKGVSPRYKLLWQTMTALVVSGMIYYVWEIGSTHLYVPFYKMPLFDLGVFYIIFSTLVIVAASNAVNITDGLDGLASGPIITSLGCLAILSYIGGHFELTRYLFLPYIEMAGELLPFLFAVLAAYMGFLWYNFYPAQVFMGDTGSLSVGGLLGVVSVLTKNEILFILIGGVFVIEALSVILQVGSFKLRGKRIFKMAPIHHHFEIKGWPESKVIARFWIISLIFAVLALATLKMR